jgi:hypothetical protein
MKPGEIYHEDVSSFYRKFSTIILWVIIIALIVIAFNQSILSSYIKPSPITIKIYLFLSVLVLGGIFASCFYSLSISATFKGIKVSYGPFHHFICWNNIVHAEQVKDPAPLKYSYDYELRSIYSSHINGQRILVYKEGRVINNNHVLLELKGDEYKYFCFTTKQPEKVLELINNNQFSG